MPKIVAKSIVLWLALSAMAWGLPTVIFNTAGSDTAASGYAQHATLAATALSGTAASMDGTTTVALNEAKDLSLVQAGDVIWVDSSSLRQFSVIVSVNDGADTVLCADTFTLTEGTKNWGIGGKRATLDNADSRTLFGSTGAKAGWQIRTETDQTLTTSLNVTAVGDITNGPITISGDSTTTHRILTETAATAVITATGGFQKYANLHFKHSGTKTTPNGLSLATNAATYTVTNCIFGDVTNTLANGVFRSGNAPNFIIDNCEFKYCTVAGISNLGAAHDVVVNGCWIHDNAIGITTTSFVCITDNLIEDNTGDGVVLTNTATTGAHEIIGNTIDGNSGDGVDVSAAGCVPGLIFKNNLFTNNANYGVRGYTNIDVFVLFNGGNGYYLSTSGHRLNLSAGTNDVVDVDPAYAGGAGGGATNNFAITAAGLKGVGYPVGGSRTVGANQSGTNTYIDIGGAQHVDAGGGGFVDPINGGPVQ